MPQGILPCFLLIDNHMYLQFNLHFRLVCITFAIIKDVDMDWLFCYATGMGGLGGKLALNIYF